MFSHSTSPSPSPSPGQAYLYGGGGGGGGSASSSQQQASSSNPSSRNHSVFSSVNGNGLNLTNRFNLNNPGGSNSGVGVGVGGSAQVQGQGQGQQSQPWSSMPPSRSSGLSGLGGGSHQPNSSLSSLPASLNHNSLSSNSAAGVGMGVGVGLGGINGSPASPATAYNLHLQQHLHHQSNSPLHSSNNSNSNNNNNNSNHSSHINSLSHLLNNGSPSPHHHNLNQNFISSLGGANSNNNSSNSSNTNGTGNTAQSNGNSSRNGLGMGNSAAGGPGGLNHPGLATHVEGQPCPQWNQQMIKAEISRQSASPHHHARAAALAARSATSSAVAIQDPTKGGGVQLPHTAANGLHLPSTKKDSLSEEEKKSRGIMEESGGRSGGRVRKPLSSNPPSDSEQTWTTIDMGGLGLKNLSLQVYKYDFLTSLFINHNSLTSLSSSIVQLKHLTVLDASGNQLTTLPSELGMLSNLRELFLFDNHLINLPPELGFLHQLELLGIEGNPLNQNLRELIVREGTISLINYLRDSCPVPLPPPEREWINLESENLPVQKDADGNEIPVETFNVLSYNVLCERMATSAMHGYTPSWALNWDYRKEFILQEVMSYSSDICCLQEVDVEQYEDYFLHHLSSQQEYNGIFSPKSRARTMREEERKHVDGCCIFFKSSKFSLIESQIIEFNQIALRRDDFKKTEDMFNRVMTKDNIAIVALLENKDSGSRLIVANTHIHWDPEEKDVKLVQVAMLIDELTKISERFSKFPTKLNVKEGYPPAPKYSSGSQIPLLVCGDFNSTPDSGVVEFLESGKIQPNHKDFLGFTYGNYTKDGADHRWSFKSAYPDDGKKEWNSSNKDSASSSEFKDQKEPISNSVHLTSSNHSSNNRNQKVLSFTNYTPDFKGVIDYIWYTENSLSVTGLLGDVDKDYLEKVVGFPNAHFPSDHVCILSEFRVKPPRDRDERVTRAVDFGPQSSWGSSNNNRDRRK